MNAYQHRFPAMILPLLFRKPKNIFQTFASHPWREVLCLQFITQLENPFSDDDKAGLYRCPFLELWYIWTAPCVKEIRLNSLIPTTATWRFYILRAFCTYNINENLGRIPEHVNHLMDTSTSANIIQMRIFKQETGYSTMGRHILQKRLLPAKDLILSGVPSNAGLFYRDSRTLHILLLL